MLTKFSFRSTFLSFTSVYIFIVLFAFPVCVKGQTSNGLYKNNGEMDFSVYKQYEKKTKDLLAASNIDLEKLLLSVVSGVSELKGFKQFIGSEIKYDKRQLTILVGEGKIRNREEIKKFIDGKLTRYKAFYADYSSADYQSNQIAARLNKGEMPFSPGGGLRTPGAPCNNMDFETANLTGWNGSWGSSQDPTGTIGFNTGPNNGLGTEHTIMTTGSDPIIPAIPCVMPGGGGASLRLGDCAGGGLYSSRISQTFMVNAASPYFTYNYAAIIQDGGSGHTAPIQPYFKIRMYAGVNNAAPAIDCASLDINGTSAATLGLTLSAGSYYYKNWTQVLIPLNAYAGTNVTIEFTVSDCMGGLDASGNPAPGSHDAWAYIDCSCNPPQIVTSSPTICGGSSITVSAPSGLASYSWTGPGIVGSSTTPTITANVAGTYSVTMTTVTSPPAVPCTFTLDTVIPGNPANPNALFSSNVVCVGNPTVFTDNSTPVGSITGWAWDFNNDGVTDATIQNPTYTFPAAGTFPVTLIVTMGPCNSTITQNVTVNPGVPPTITPSGPYCTNAAPVTLSGTPAGGTWSGTGITNPATGAFDPAAAAVGNNTITYTFAGPCGGSANTTIVINPLPVSNAGPDVTICSGTAATIGTATTAGDTYSWLPAAGLSSTTISNPGITTVNAGTTPIVTTYTVTTTALTCSSSDQVVVTVNPVPVLTITNPPAVCSPGTVDITAAAVTAGSTGGGVLSYWNDAAATSPLAAPTAVATSGTYYIKSTATGGCTDIKPVVVTINPLPVSDAGPDITICSGTAATIGAATTAGDTYSWLPAAGLSSTTISNPGITTVNAGTTAIVTTYTVTTTALTCTSTDQVVVTVNPPVTSNAGPPQTICAGTSAILAGTIGGGGVAGAWSGGAGTFTPDALTLNASYTPSAAEEGAGNVTLTLTSSPAAGPCPPVTSTVTITINPIATINAGPDQTICIGNTAQLAGTIGGGATTGTWTGGAGTYSTSNTDPLAVYTPSAGETAAGTVTLTFTSDDPAGPCGPVSDDIIITIAALPTANAGPDQTICDGTSAILAGAIGGAATSATWTGGAGTFAPSATALNASYTPTAAETATGSVTLTLTTNDPAGPCTFASDQMIITINPVATINAGPDQTICIGSTVTLAGVTGGSATTGTWSGGAGTFAPSATTANAIYTPTAGEGTAGTVNLTYTSDDPAGPCPSVTDQIVITINQVATANAGSAQHVCSGSNVTLGGAIGGSATGGTWSGGAGTFTPNNTTLNAVYTPTAAEFAADSVVLTLTTNDPAGPCTFASSNVTLYFYQNPVAAFTVVDPNGCPVHCASFTDLSTVGGGDIITTWSWDLGDGSTSAIQNPAHCYQLTGLYDVTLTVTTNHGCTGTLTIPHAVQVYAVPHAEFSPTPNPASVLDPTVTLNNESSSDVDYWFWSFGDGDTLSPNTPSPVHSYPNATPGTYTTTLIVHNADGCYDTVPHDIIIGPEFTFYIPNAFTPNGDGVNDFFFGSGIGITVYDIWIFDRWGNMIFHGNYLDDYWDGRANGGSEMAQQDVYVWKVKLTDVFGKKHDYIGTVTIVK